MKRGPMNGNGSKKRSLLGFDEPEGDDPLKGTHEHLVAQKEAKLGQLLEGTLLLKREAEEIDVELGMSKRQLDAISALMSDTQGGIGSVMEKLKAVTATASSRHVFYLVLFIVFILFILYYFVRK